MITTKEYSVKNRNRTINGVLYIPAHNVKGSVIFSHGYNGSYKHSDVECILLAEVGYYTYAFDFPGGSNDSISTGLPTTEMTLFTEKEDLLAVFNSISSLSYIYGKPTFLLGRSQGGCVTGLLAAELKEHLPAIILYYPAFMIPEMAQKEYPVVKKIPPETEIWDMKVGKDYIASIHDLDPYKIIGNYQGRVLVLYGDRDDVVPRETIDRTMETYGKAAELMILEGEGHGFSEEGKKASVERILGFIEHL